MRCGQYLIPNYKALASLTAISRFLAPFVQATVLSDQTRSAATANHPSESTVDTPGQPSDSRSERGAVWRLSE
ncbi:MAG: hypothetical protein QOD87_1227 [Pseudonocardiales bacterium]|nr:hypothetical protein [Pseudonocardiales bacterium]